jgi:hypothetical protein
VQAGAESGEQNQCGVCHARTRTLPRRKPGRH